MSRTGRFGHFGHPGKLDGPFSTSVPECFAPLLFPLQTLNLYERLYERDQLQLAKVGLEAIGASSSLDVKNGREVAKVVKTVGASSSERAYNLEHIGDRR